MNFINVRHSSDTSKKRRSSDDDHQQSSLSAKKLAQKNTLIPQSPLLLNDQDFSTSNASSNGEKQWQIATHKVVRSTVSLHFAFVNRFDTESATVSEATGFIVDAEKGIIMTNRHVVGPGPFTGYAVFDNHEECQVLPIYRDPVHDFGFLRFDPSDINHMKVEALELRPERAKIGCEIRVVGNDAGEKLSILSGFISRVDRNAPDYAGLSYNDFNTAYIQAAASASGGSSGSPVVNINGDVVALQAGGSTEASTDFFLPLYRGKRALECIQRGEMVTRGTIQTQWLLKPFDECRRLGLTEESEENFRQEFPNSIGLLMAATVIPDGNAWKSIEEGDCLISVNGEKVNNFTRLDEILDSSIGKTLDIVIQRGGKDLSVKIPVTDLHSITPDKFVEAVGAIFHNLSYQVARLYSIPVKGVYIADASGAFGNRTWGSGYILDELDHRPTPDIDAFIDVMKSIPDGKRVFVRYKHVGDLHTENTDMILIDRKWYPTFRLAVRNDETGLWDFTDLSKNTKMPPRVLPVPQKARFPELNLGEPGCQHLLKSFVLVTVNNQSKIEGYYLTGRWEFGVVVDAEKGYVIVSRRTVPHDLCEIHISVAASVTVPAKVVFLHPLQNYAIIAYDPKLVEADIQSVKLSNEPLKIGSKQIFIGHNYNKSIVSTKTRVTSISTVVIPLRADISPRYRGINIDSISIDTSLSTDCASGVIADPDGTIRGLWLSFLADNVGNGDREFRLGIDVAGGLRHVVEQLGHSDVLPNPRFLDIEMDSLTIVQARYRGVSDEWIHKVEEASPQRPQLFNVSRVAQGAADILREGDVILAIGGKVVTKISDFDVMYNTDKVELTIVRNGIEMQLFVPTVSNNDLITNRIINWCGAVIHKPHHAVCQEIKKPPSGVYVVWCSMGSPALQYGLASTYFITSVNGVATPNLEEFSKQIAHIPDNTYVKLGLVTFDNVRVACSIKTNYHYFPTTEQLRQDTGEWKNYVYEDGKRILQE